MTQDNAESPKRDHPSAAEHDLLPELGLKRPAQPEPTDVSAPENSKATEFDGSPAPEGAPDGPLGPKDDTPAILKKKEGPRNDG